MSSDSLPHSAEETQRGAPEAQAERNRAKSDDDRVPLVKHWFEEARENGYDFVYLHRNQTNARMMIVAEGYDSRRLMRILVDTDSEVDNENRG